MQMRKAITENLIQEDDSLFWEIFVRGWSNFRCWIPKPTPEFEQYKANNEEDCATIEEIKAHLKQKQERANKMNELWEKQETEMKTLSASGRWVFLDYSELINYSNFLEKASLYAAKEISLDSTQIWIEKFLLLKNNYVIWNFNDIPIYENQIYISNQPKMMKDIIKDRLKIGGAFNESNKYKSLPSISLNS